MPAVYGHNHSRRGHRDGHTRGGGGGARRPVPGGPSSPNRRLTYDAVREQEQRLLRSQRRANDGAERFEHDASVEQNALFAAARRGDAETVASLIRNLPSGKFIHDILDRKGRTIMHVAVCNGHIRLAERILDVIASCAQEWTNLQDKLDEERAAYFQHLREARLRLELLAARERIQALDKIERRNVTAQARVYREMFELREQMWHALVDCQDARGRTVLHYAARLPCTSMEFLFHPLYLADTSARVQSAELPEMFARVFSPQAVASIQARRREVLDIQDDNGNTALHVAAAFSNLDGVKSLLGLGASKSLLNGDGLTAIEIAPNLLGQERIAPLHQVIEDLSTAQSDDARSIAMAELRCMVSRQDDEINVCTDSKLSNGLHAATKAAEPEIVAYLLAMKGNPLIRDANGWLPVHYAAAGGSANHVRAMMLLLETIREVQGEEGVRECLLSPSNSANTALHIAASSVPAAKANSGGSSSATSAQTVRDLEDRNPALYAAREEAFCHSIRALVALRASIEARDDHGRTPLLSAVRHGHHKRVQCLLLLGASLGACVVSKRCWTPFHVASRRRHFRTLEVLQNFDFDQPVGRPLVAQIRDAQGQLPMDLVRQSRGRLQFESNIFFACWNADSTRIRSLLKQNFHSDSEVADCRTPLKRRSLIHVTLCGLYHRNRGQAKSSRHKHRRAIQYNPKTKRYGPAPTPTATDGWGTRVTRNDANRKPKKAWNNTTTLSKSYAANHFPSGFSKSAKSARHTRRGGVRGSSGSTAQPGNGYSSSANSGSISCLRMLVRAKVSVNETDAFDQSPLMLAASLGLTDVCETLLACRANVNLQDMGGNTALHYARAFGATSSPRVGGRSAQREMRVGSVLIEAGADDTVRNGNGDVAAVIKCGPDALHQMAASASRLLHSGKSDEHSDEPSDRVGVYSRGQLLAIVEEYIRDDGNDTSNNTGSLVALEMEYGEFRHEPRDVPAQQRQSKPPRHEPQRKSAPPQQRRVFDDSPVPLQQFKPRDRDDRSTFTRPGIEFTPQKAEGGGSVPSTVPDRPQFEQPASVPLQKESASRERSRSREPSNARSRSRSQSQASRRAGEAAIARSRSRQRKTQERQQSPSNEHKPARPVSGSNSRDNSVGAGRIADEQTAFTVLQKVECNYGGEGKWYPGSIAKVNSDGTFNISYDDGDSEENVPADRIRSLRDAAEPAAIAASAGQAVFSVLQKVEGNYGGEGKWYPGSISKVNSNGTYNIGYDDGDSEENVPAARIRAGGGTSEPATAASDDQSQFAVLQKVEANYAGEGKWYPGSIAKVNTNGTYKIGYDDGDSEDNVPADHIRARGQEAAPVNSSAIADGQPSFTVLQKVEGNYGGEGKWYPGSIAKVNSNGTYSIGYDDGDAEENVPADRIRVPSDGAAPAVAEAAAETDRIEGGGQTIFTVLQKVEGNYGGEGKWYAGSIAKVNSNGTYNIGYDDGDSEENVPADRIRALSDTAEPAPAPASTIQAAFTVLQKVEGNYGGEGKWYPGSIAKVNSNGTFDIGYDDGDSEQNVPADRIRARVDSADPAPAAATTVQGTFTVLQKVEGNYGGEGKWYPGSIAKVNSNGTYNIGYDDGDSEDNVPADRIRALGEAAEPAPAAASVDQAAFSVLQKVEANYGGEGKWYPGSIAKVNSNGTYNIGYDDGDSEENVPADRVRARDDATETAPAPARTVQAAFTVSQKVEGNYGGEGKWYPGSISKVNSDGSYNIAYDDGDSEGNVPADRIRALGNAAAPAAASAGQAAFTVLQKVEGNYGGEGKWYPGSIAKVNSNGTYNIGYDDGDSEENVAADRIRARGTAAEPAPAAGNAGQAAFTVLQKVEGNYGGEGKWYPGSIAKVNSNGSYNIGYDDGDSEENVPADRIRARGDTAEPAPAVTSTGQAAFTVLQKVEGNYGGEGKWYPGSIAKVNSNGTYNIGYDDGDSEENVPADRIRARDGAAAQVAAASATNNGGGARDEASQAVFTVLQKVEGNYGGEGKWYPGSIAKVNTDGTYNIGYDDGDAENDVPADRIRAFGDPAADDGAHSQSLQVGQKVEANFAGEGKWYPGKIAAANSDGSYKVVYDDGDKEDSVAPTNVRAVDASPADAVLSIGDNIEANFGGRGQWYAGSIAAVNDDGTFDIVYDDGDTEASVARNNIRLQNAHDTDDGSVTDTNFQQTVGYD